MNAVRLALLMAAAFGAGLASSASLTNEEPSPYDDQFDPRIDTLRAMYREYDRTDLKLSGIMGGRDFETLPGIVDEMRRVMENPTVTGYGHRREIDRKYPGLFETYAAAENLSWAIRQLRRSIEAGPYDTTAHERFKAKIGDALEVYRESERRSSGG